MTREKIEEMIWEAAKEGDYIDFRDDIFLVFKDGTKATRYKFNHLDDLTNYINNSYKIIKDIKCIDGIIRGGGRDTTCNLFKIYVIDAHYTYDELIELGYTFKEINKILKQQEEEL